MKNKIGDSVTSFVLFLNKVDLFRQKISTKLGLQKFQKLVSSCQGYEDAIDFVKGMYKSKYLAMTRNDELPVHVTCALDTEAMKFVFETMRTQMLSASFSDNGVIM